MKLKDLQKNGSLAANLVVCKNYSATTVSELGKYSDEQKAKVSAVVLDNSIWVATPNREPPARADSVYSHDGTNFGFWNRKNHSFSTMELLNGSLVATKIINLKGETNMSEVNLEASLEEAFSKAGMEDTPEKMNLGELPKANSQEEDAEKAEKKRAAEQRRMEKEAKLNHQAQEIKALASRANTNYTIDPKFIENNRRKGRLLGFFVGADPVVKMSLKQTPINSGTTAAPKYTLRPGVNLDADLSKKFADGTKNIGAKYLQCKTDIVMREAAPSTIVAGAVKIPAMTEISNISELDGSRKWDQSAAESDATVLKVLPKEALYAYLELNFNKVIQEDESIPGNTKILVRTTEVKAKDVAGSSAAKRKFRTRLVAEGRSTFVDGNYFPLETYDTVNLGSAGSEDRKLANNNFAALVKQYNAAPRTNKNGETAAKKGDFSEEASAMFQISDSNASRGEYVCTSAIVDKGTTYQCRTFSSRGKTELKMDITRLPVREVKESKDGTSVRYTYRKSKFNAGPNPAISDPKYASFIDRISKAANGVDFETIATNAKKESRAATKPRAVVSAADKISGIEMLGLRANTTVDVDSVSNIEDIFAAFKAAAY